MLPIPVSQRPVLIRYPLIRNSAARRILHFPFPYWYSPLNSISLNLQYPVFHIGIVTLLVYLLSLLLHPSGIIRLANAYSAQHGPLFRFCGTEHYIARQRIRAAMSGKKILVVEDDNLQLTTLARRLKSAGFEVVAARDGLTAISTARKEQPDLILLDLGLPAGDGFVVLQRLGLLINTGTIPIIVVSSRPPLDNRDAALKAGAIAYIHKPVDISVLLKTINEALGLSPPEPPPEPPQPPPSPQP
jgi:CheY-like chemotaxis protein